MTNQLSIFLDWRVAAKKQLEELGFNVSFFNAPQSENNSASIVFKNNSIEAAITAWEYGDVFPEAYYVPHDDFFPIEKIECQGDVTTVLDQYLEAIVSYPNDASEAGPKSCGR